MEKETDMGIRKADANISEITGLYHRVEVGKKKNVKKYAHMTMIR